MKNSVIIKNLVRRINNNYQVNLTKCFQNLGAICSNLLKSCKKDSIIDFFLRAFSIHLWVPVNVFLAKMWTFKLKMTFKINGEWNIILERLGTLPNIHGLTVFSMFVWNMPLNPALHIRNSQTENCKFLLFCQPMIDLLDLIN